MASSLSGKVVIITGASSGIGEGTAEHFAALGSKLCLVGRNSENLDKVAASCKQKGNECTEVLTVTGDITKKEDQKEIIDQTISKYGRIDVLVNNAGICKYNKCTETSEQDYDDIFETNTKAQVFLTSLAIPHLKETKGNIVNVSSICGSRAAPLIGIYCMSKAALDMYTECLSLEMAPFGVRVNSITPASVVSNIHRRPGGFFADDEAYKKFVEIQNLAHPLGRIGVPKDCAEAIAFLASESASFVTGQRIYIDGGRHCMTPSMPSAQK